MTQYIIEGQYVLDPHSQQWAMPGWTPPRYWDVIECEDEQELAAYLSGQQPFIKEEFPAIAYGQEARSGAAPVNVSAKRKESTPRGGVTHVCARCNRECKPQFKYCYRCNQYNKVKAKLAQEESKVK
jgi:hypothetical protein